MEFTLGADGVQKEVLRQENHGRFLNLKDGESKQIVPLVYFKSTDLPTEIIDLQKTDPHKFMEEAIKRTIFSFKNAEIWLDPDKIKKYNEGLGEGVERLRTKYTMQTAFGSNKEASVFVDIDPVAWLATNPEIFESSPYYTSGKFGNNAIVPKSKSYIIVYVPEFDAEMLLEVSANQLKYIGDGLEMGGNLTHFYRNIFNVTKTKPDGKANQYKFIRVGEVSPEDNVPMVTTLDLENMEALGIAYDETEKRKHILEMIGVGDKFPTGVVWNK